QRPSFEEVGAIRVVWLVDADEQDLPRYVAIPVVVPPELRRVNAVTREKQLGFDFDLVRSHARGKDVVAADQRIGRAAVVVVEETKGGVGFHTDHRYPLPVVEGLGRRKKAGCGEDGSNVLLRQPATLRSRPPPLQE